MSNRTRGDKPPRDRAFTSAFALLATALGCTIVLLSVPREAPPSLPVLRLERSAVHAQLRRDAQLAAGVERSPAVEALLALLLEVGQQELKKHSVDRGYMASLPKKLAELEPRLGSAGLESVRALATERFMAALRGELADVEQARGLLGDQPGLLMSYGYLDSAGALLAPELSVRATYKVRFNLLFGRAAGDGLSRVERCAYEGFRGLEALDMPPQIRGQALHEYARAGCAQAAEALAIWSAQNGEPQSLLALARAEQPAPTIRLRNMALGFLRRDRELGD